jgi:hypothetical protein
MVFTSPERSERGFEKPRSAVLKPHYGPSLMSAGRT